MTNEKPYQVKYSPDSEMILIYVLKDDGEIEPIAYLDTPKIGTPEFDESMKRARLMAAGPEIYEAATKWPRCCDQWQDGLGGMHCRDCSQKTFAMLGKIQQILGIGKNAKATEE